MKIVVFNIADISIGVSRGGPESKTNREDTFAGKFKKIILFFEFISEFLRTIIGYTRICSFGSNIQIIITS